MYDISVVDPFWLTMMQVGKMRHAFGFIPIGVKILFIPVLHNQHWALHTFVNCQSHEISVGDGCQLKRTRNELVSVDQQ